MTPIWLIAAKGLVNPDHTTVPVKEAALAKDPMTDTLEVVANPVLMMALERAAVNLALERAVANLDHMMDTLEEVNLALIMEAVARDPVLMMDTLEEVENLVIMTTMVVTEEEMML